MRDAEGVRELRFGGDGCYRAYECFGNDVEIGAHYKEQFTLKSWVTIYDDEGKRYFKHSEDVGYKLCTVYRAGDYGLARLKLKTPSN
ncbi:MAG: hypothetical protein IJ004_06225 [Clostridia bacterium]|nr:hypothetical protein [Clostridia bacterium]